MWALRTSHRGGQQQPSVPAAPAPWDVDAPTPAPPAATAAVPSTTTQLFHLQTSLQQQLQALTTAWRKRLYTRVLSTLQALEEVLDPAQPHTFSLFLGLGGIDRYVHLVCEPSCYSPYVNITSDKRHQEQLQLRHIYNVTLRTLTELLICHNDLGWYFYDRYPGVFFRLLELIEVPVVSQSAGCFLEHLVSCVGPVLEIAKTPRLVQLLRSSDDGVFVLACRVVALLIIVPTVERDYLVPCRRLLYPETLLSLKRVQRVIDSNVLWLQGETGFIARLIELCELRSRSIQVRQGNQVVTLFPLSMNNNDNNNNNNNNNTNNNRNLAAAAAAAAGAAGAPPANQLANALANYYADFEDEEEEEEDEELYEDIENEEEEEAEESQEGEGRGGGAANYMPPPYPRPDERTAMYATAAAASADNSGMFARVSREIINALTSLRLPGGDGAIAGAAGGRAAPFAAPTGNEAVDTNLNYINTVASQAQLLTNMLESLGMAEPPPAAPPALLERVARIPMASRRGAAATNQAPPFPPAAAPPPPPPATAAAAAVPQVVDALPGTPLLINPAAANSGEANALDMDFLQQLMEDEVLAYNSDEYDTTDFRWFLGTVGSRQRWRLCDCTLHPPKDDNRPALFGYGSQRSVLSQDRFDAKNQEGMLLLLRKRYEDDGSKEHPFSARQRAEVVVESQSELLFVLNVMLSTFYFSSVWQQMQKCHWIPRALLIYDSAFGLDDTAGRMVDVPPHIDIADEVLQLPPYQPAPAAPERPPHLPAQWCLPPFLSILQKGTASYSPLGLTGATGASLENFVHVVNAGLFADEDEFLSMEEKHHQHGPGTIRKLELLRSVHEYWNTQDMYEGDMLQTDDQPAGALLLAKKIAETLQRNDSDSCVETSACHALEAYLRAFSFPHTHDRCNPSSPQSVIGPVLLDNFLRDRIYNGTRVPGIPNSLTSTRRIDALYAVLAEVVRHHYHHLRTLNAYVRGDQHLEQLAPVSEATRRALRRRQRADALLQNPPLDRQLDEPFGSVLLRRLYENACDTNLFIRTLVLSLTPGLRSRHNYIHKPVTAETVGVRMPQTEGRVGDLVINHSLRLAFIREISREYTAEISDTVLKGADAGAGGPSRAARLEAAAGRTEALVRALQHVPHRATLEERPFPDLLDEMDIAILRGEAEMPAAGPPPRWRVPLFDDAVDEAEGLEQLQELATYFLGEPAKLVYSMLRPLNLERMAHTGRLCVISTAILVFLREATLHGGEGGVRAVLDAIVPFAEASRAEWMAFEHRRRTDAAVVDTAARRCTCAKAAKDPLYSCRSFQLFGACKPSHAASEYYAVYGGCFFHNFFRLLCLWVGHYWSCQRYVETLFYCTEVSFAECKTICMYLFRVLPSYFLQPPTEEEWADYAREHALEGRAPYPLGTSSSSASFSML